MKLQIPIPLWMFTLIVFGVGFAGYVQGQLPTSRLTSDATLSPHGLPMAPMPNQSGIFVPKSSMVFVELRTSTVPLVVEITVTSNIINRDVSWIAGRPFTNDYTITNWVVSRTTNEMR
jgi:hypothetical protein